MDQEELFRRLAVALAIGLLVGLERGWQTREESDNQRAAGLRTFALTGLLGGICGLLSIASGPVVLAAGFLALTGAIGSFSYLEARSEQNFSATGVVAAALTFALGAYATLGNEAVAVAAAVAMAILLALRESLHNWVRKLTWLEIRSALMLLAMTFLLLPILPNRPIDPWQVLNPAEIWLFAILIAAISFAGYVAIRALGERKGVAVAAIAGGLTSSTATTLSFARLARDNPQSTRLLAGGILLAGATMLARLVALAAIIKPALLTVILGPAAAAGAVLLTAAGLLMWHAGGDGAKAAALELRNPFDLTTVLQLGGLIAVIMVVAKVLADRADAAGLYLLAAVSGIADVDALTLSMARFAGTQVGFTEASTAILVAAAVNTVAKALMAGGVGGARLGTWVGGSSAAALAALALAHLAFR